MSNWLLSLRGEVRRSVPSILTAAILTLLLSPTAGAQSQIAQSQAEYVPGEMIVKLKGKNKSIEAQAFIGKAVSEHSMTLKKSWSGINLHHFKVRHGQKVEDAIQSIQDDPAVEFAEPNYVVHRQSVGGVEQAVSMSEVQSQSGAGTVQASSSNTTAQTAAPIGLGQAWGSMSLGKTPPVVAVIDTGIDLNHTVFVNSGAIWTNMGEIASNGLDDDKNGYIDDVHGWNFVASTNSPQDDDGHGTHVSGIILGTTQDITASPIAAAQIRIMPLKFLDSTGSGSTADAVNAIYYAVNNGAKVLSNSWGGNGYSASLLQAITYAYNKNAVFVAAAGNASSNNDSTPTYPANYSVPNMMSIAATDDADGFASFSNYGASTVNIGSPGVSIWSTYPNNMYARLSGTSMATPFVAGVAALMVREQPSMNGYQVKTLLFGGTNQVSSLVGKTSQKARLNVYNALAAAQGATVSSTLPAYDSSSASRSPSSASAGGMGGCGLVAKKIYDNGGGDDGPGSTLSGAQKNMAFFALLAVMIAPILLSLGLRNRQGKNLRRHTRYQIDSSVRVKFGERELVGQVSTISLGGLQLNTDEWLEKGGVVTMSIRSPDGRDEIQVEGKIVWSEEQKRYGVAFANTTETVSQAISRWTQSLLRV